MGESRTDSVRTHRHTSDVRGGARCSLTGLTVMWIRSCDSVIVVCVSQSGHVFVLLSDILYVSCDARVIPHALAPDPQSPWLKHPACLRQAEKRMTKLSEYVYRVDVEAGSDYNGAVLYSANVVPFEAYENGMKRRWGPRRRDFFLPVRAVHRSLSRFQ